MAEILPCPFCGDDRVVVTEVTPRGHAAECGSCGAFGPMWAALPLRDSLHRELDVEEATAAWNSRSSADLRTLRPLRRRLAEQGNEIALLRSILQKGLERQAAEFEGPSNATLRCCLESWQRLAKEALSDAES